MHVVNIFDAIKYIVYFILLFICAYTDYKYGKIYNKNLLLFLLFFAIFSAIEYIFLYITKNNEISLVRQQLIDNIIGFIIAFVVGFLFYALGVFKGGDAKLLAVVGLCAGKGQVLSHFATIMIVAGIAALYILIKNGILVSRLKRVFLYLKGLILVGRFDKYVTENNDKIHFPFAVYILLGEIISYLNFYLRG